LAADPDPNTPTNLTVRRLATVGSQPASYLGKRAKAAKRSCHARLPGTPLQTAGGLRKKQEYP